MFSQYCFSRLVTTSVIDISFVILFERTSNFHTVRYEFIDWKCRNNWDLFRSLFSIWMPSFLKVKIAAKRNWLERAPLICGKAASLQRQLSTCNELTYSIIICLMLSGSNLAGLIFPTSFEIAFLWNGWPLPSYA